VFEPHDDERDTVRVPRIEVRKRGDTRCVQLPGDRDGVRCDEPAPKRGNYYFIDGTNQYFTLDGLTFETAKAILDTYAAGRISRLPEMLSTSRVNITSIKALFDNRYRLIFGEYFCGGCSTVFDADFDTRDGESHLTVVGQPQGGCY